MQHRQCTSSLYRLCREIINEDSGCRLTYKGGVQQECKIDILRDQRRLQRV